MPLIALWKSSPSAVGDLSIEQIVAMAGDGNLKDGSPCSGELREYLSQIPSGKIAAYIEQCLSSSFQKGGMVLQDLVNELGRRLDYAVINGRYQGTTKDIGYDGIWVSPEKHTIIVEVKTTDAYRITLEAIAGYRDRLLAKSEITAPCSMLIIVGRQDTGDLEAQVRGSRHAWDIRLVSASALLKLVKLKENADDPETGRKIRNVLVPTEYTRLDDLIDVVFTAAADVETDTIGEPESASGVPPRRDGALENGAGITVQETRDQIIAAMESRLRVHLVRKSRALSWDSEHLTRISCTISKRYTGRYCPYWYAYHPQWDEFLHDGKRSFFVLGCTDQPFAFAIPWRAIHAKLDDLNTTTTGRSTY
jgi:hypothetical protein